MITSTHNPLVARAARLKRRAMREREHRFLVEGPRGVVEAMAAGAVDHLFVDPGRSDALQDVRSHATGAGLRVHDVAPEVMRHLSSTLSPQGVVAVARFVDVGLDALQERRSGEPSPFVAVLVEVRDPGNAGTILRSADASGSDGVVLSPASVDVYNPKTVRAAAGSLFHVPVVRQVDALPATTALRGSGFRVLAAVANGDQSVFEADLTGPVAILFGNEVRGLASDLRAIADGTVRVPMSGRAESLNLAAAATVILFECARRRRSDLPGRGERARQDGPAVAHRSPRD